MGAGFKILLLTAWASRPIVLCVVLLLIIVFLSETFKYFLLQEILVIVKKFGRYGIFKHYISFLDDKNSLLERFNKLFSLFFQLFDNSKLSYFFGVV